jgi:ferredoxin-NADP reductase
MFLASRKVGFYLRVLREGEVGENDSIELLERDPASPTIEAFVRLTHYEYWDAQGLLELLNARDLMPAWREIIEAKLARALAASGWQGLREFELVAREEEGANIVSLRLKCLRGRPLAPFHGGQQLGIVLGGRSAHQQRRAYPLSGNPHELSTYRITLRAPSPGETQRPDRAVAAHLAGMQVGEHILCTAPHWTSPQLPQSLTVRIPVLLGRGLGIAPLLSLLHEYAAQPAPAAWLYHEAGEHDAQALLREARALAERNSGLHMGGDTAGTLDIASICRKLASLPAEFLVAGPADFVERMVRELNTACPAPVIRIVQNFG